ncbi:MAG: hemerythrin family protein [Magnetospirillum sp.]|nr:hemerythrin family protein [Magnetospirillum sp.]
MMIQWQTRYETGITDIDDDHRRLVALINDLDSALAQDGDMGLVGRVIDALVEYADYHFSREEALMAEAGFDDLAGHVESHADFGQFLGAMVGGCILNPSRETAARIIDYLQEWLVDHILVEDMKYVPLVRGRASSLH